MSKSLGRPAPIDHDSLFPEFREEEAHTELDGVSTEDLSIRPKKDPVVLSVLAKLAKLLADETTAIRAGDFEAFAELQRQKGSLIRQAERLENNRSAYEAMESLEPEALKAKLDGFTETVESNMRTIGAVKDAIGHVRTQAIKKLEEEKGDGVYSKDGERKSLHRLSLNETQVKL
ncbi:MAG: flagellar export chaperone FlgN [Pseudomonadota bacterium]